MLIFSLMSVLISNAVATNINKSILYSRNLIFTVISVTAIAVNTFYLKPLNTSLGLFNGFFNISLIGQYFNLFIFVVVSIIAILTAFFPRKLYNIWDAYIIDLPVETDIEQSKKHIEKVNLSSLLDGYNIENKADTKDLPSEISTHNNNGISTYNNDGINTHKNDEKTKDILLNKNGFQYSILEYSLIILFVLCGAILLISTGDLLSLFLSIELQSYGLYIISTIYRDSESATNSGLTYFLLGGLSSCFILLGSAILYVNSGNTNLDNIFIVNSIREQMTDVNEIPYMLSNSTYTSTYINFSFIILVVGLLFKISAAPFHFWSPDVYDGIPTIVTTFVAIIAKISLLMVMLELVSYTDINIDSVQVGEKSINSVFNHNIDFNWKNILLLSSLMSLVIGSILGLSQYRIKRLFAYSTISHVGFILLALAINKVESIQGYIFYILQYSLSNLNAFFILVTMAYTLHRYISNAPSKKDKDLKSKKLVNVNNTKDKLIDVENSPVQLLSQIKGYFYVNSYISISFAITLFSFVGIPPLIGFFAKQMVLSAALDQGYIFITFVAIITSVIGAAYYLNLVKLIFFTKSEYEVKNTSKDELYSSISKNKESIYVNDKLSITISILTMLILLFIFMPDEWFRMVSILSFSVSKY